MNSKSLSGIIGLACSVIALTACNAGNSSSSSPSISAAIASGCTNMSTGQPCNISITYNLNGTSGNTLSYNFTPSVSTCQSSYINSDFNSSFLSCQAQVSNNSGTSASQVCSVQIEYVNCGQPNSATISFSLGGVTSNLLTLTGN